MLHQIAMATSIPSKCSRTTLLFRFRTMRVTQAVLVHERTAYLDPRVAIPSPPRFATVGVSKTEENDKCSACLLRDFEEIDDITWRRLRFSLVPGHGADTVKIKGRVLGDTCVVTRLPDSAAGEWPASDVADAITDLVERRPKRRKANPAMRASETKKKNAVIEIEDTAKHVLET